MNLSRVLRFAIVSALVAGTTLAQYSGTYTIDPAAAKFRSFKEVADSLTLYGISGHCIFEAVGGTYTGQATLTSVSGSGQYSTTFRPKPGEVVFIDATSAQQGFKISGTNNVILEDLRIGKATADGILFENCNSGTVKRCSIFGTVSGSPSNGIELNNASNIELVSTHVKKTGGNQGIYINVNSSGARVRGCNVSGTSNYSLYIGAADVVVESTTVSCTGGSGGIGTNTSATGCFILGCDISSSSGYGIDVRPEGISVDTTKVTMTGGSAGIYFYQNARNGRVRRGTVVAGTATYGIDVQHAANTVIDGVAVSGGQTAAIYVEQSNSAGSVVRNCQVTSSGTNGGIYVYSTTKVAVENCQITMSGGSSGVHLSSADGCRVEGCTVNGNSSSGISVSNYSDEDSIIGNRVFTTGVRGIGLFSFTGTNRGKQNRVYNNFVYGYTDTAVSALCQEGLGLYYNTLVGSTTGNSRYGVFLSEGVSVVSRNNIIWNPGTGSSYCYNLQNSSSFTESNNNDLYCPSGYVGRINTTDYQTLGNWQGTGNDGNSISADPGIVGAPDLHLAQGSPCIGKGAIVTDIARDIDGQLRKTGVAPNGPDIGADEYLSAPGAVALVSPVNGSRNVAAQGNLQWTGGANADSFRVYLGTGNPPSLYQGNVSGSPFYYTGLTNGALYYWFIVAKNGAGLTSSDTWSFRVALGAPTLVLPAAGAKNVPAEGDLSWSAGGGATKWSVFLGASSTPESVPIDPVTTNSYHYSGLANGGRYYWTIAAKDEYGQRTASSEVRDFYVRLGAPVQTYPPDDTTEMPLAGTLTWSGGAGANTWTVFFGTSADAPDSVANVDVPEYAYAALPGQRYYWTVAAKDRNVPGQRTAAERVFSFTTLDKPGGFTLSSPGPGAKGVSLSASLNWDRADRAESYDIYLDTRTPPVLKQNVSGESYSPPDLVQNTDYYWKVVAKNGAGETENTGGIQTFRTVLAEAPVLVTPAAGDTTRKPQQRRPEFSWTGLSLPAAAYDVQVDNNDDFQSPEYTVGGISANSWIPDEPGLEEGHWYWRVRGDNGAPGPWCESFFDVFVDLNPPAKPIPVSPVGGVKVATLRPVLEWEGTDDTRLFRLTIRSEGLPPFQRDIEQPENTRRTSYELEQGEELENLRNYTWTVEALDYAGNSAGPGDEGVFEVELDDYDAGVTAIHAPAGDVAENDNIRPKVVVANFGNREIRPYVRVTITGPADEEWSVSEQVDEVIPARGEPLTYEFAASWTASLPGSYQVRCSTELAGDGNNDNDSLMRSFRVLSSSPLHDVGAVAIVEPVGRAFRGLELFPAVAVANFGDVPEPEVPVRLTITGPADEVVYDEAVTVSLARGEVKGIVFTVGWTPGKPGDHNVVCQTELSTDARPDNNRRFRTCTVFEASWPEGWEDVSPMPTTPSAARPPKAGAWLVTGPDRIPGPKVIYAAKGNKTSDFYKYYPEKDSWATLLPIPDIEPAIGKSKFVSKGSRAASDGKDYLYMLKGSGTQGFWRYRVEDGRWDTLARVPQKIKGGNDLAYVKRQGKEYIYLLAGGKTAFYRYDIESQQWTMLESVPYGRNKKKYGAGSFLVHDRANSLYAHQANVVGDSFHYMFRYDLAKGSWQKTALRGVPLYGTEAGKLNKKKKSKDGAGAVWYEGRIYAVKGGGSQGFFRYNPTGDSWTAWDTIPRTGRAGTKGVVKAGGSLVNWNDRAFFLLKGNKTYEFWRYGLGAFYAPSYTPQASGAQAQAQAQAVVLRITPNPIASGFAVVRLASRTVPGRSGRNPGQSPLMADACCLLTIYDAAGRCVYRSALSAQHSAFGIPLDLRKLSAGVYLVRLDAAGMTASQKLVLQKQ